MPFFETRVGLGGNLDICDNEEANVTVIPMPSTLSLVTAETSSTDDLNSIANAETATSFADFEDEIVGKVIRNNQQQISIVNVVKEDSSGNLNLPPPSSLSMPSLPLSVTLPQTPVEVPGVVLPTIPVLLNTYACNICKKECNSEADLAIHKKRHKLDGPLKCEYCNNTYTDRHRYEVHVRHHTGETPFKCHICGKGFRDDRKMRLHVARHNSGLNNKCHLCPRSFEGPKALQKHLQAHEMGRVVKPKVIMNADGSTSMALPTESGAGGPGSGNAAIGTVGTDSLNAATAVASSVIQPQLASVIGSDGQPQQVVAIMPAPLQPNESTDTTNSIESKAGLSGSTAVATTDDGHGTISLSMDDLMQYAQPVPDSVIHDENGLEDKLTAGATTKFVQLNMDEFNVNVGQAGQGSSIGSMGLHHNDIDDHDDHVGQLHNDSGEFPDLLDSESNLESLSFASASRPKSLKVHEDQESGLTFATLSGVKPVYPDGLESSTDKTNVVVARKSAAVPVNKPSIQQQQVQSVKVEAAGQLSDGSVNIDGNLNAQVKTEDLVSVLANEAISQLSKQIKLPAGTCLVPADAKCEPATIAGCTTDQAQLDLLSTASVANQNNPSNPMTITIQYKIYPDSQSEPQKVAVQRDLVDIISEAPPPASADHDGQAETTTQAPVIAPVTQATGQQAPAISKSSTKVKPMGVDMDPLDLPAVPVQPPPGPDPAKETRKVISASGKEFDVPTIVTSGYDLDKLMCTFCTKPFKNDKTLMSHMLHHFGVTPKMASCPICGLTLQKKSYARHLRLHGNVVPEICPYCNKEFREKRSLDKHIKAIHHAERPFACPIADCNETFRNQVELKNHHNRHIKDYPFECDRCPMTFQKQDSLTTHYRSHTGEKPFVCEICDKTFTSEKNKKVHVQRHQGSLPHRCDVCGMTFQSRSHLIKHATSHSRKPQVVQTTATALSASSNNTSSNKINNFLESFTASLGDDMLGGLEESFGSSTENKQNTDDNSLRLSVDTLPENLEAAAAEAAFALNRQDLSEELLRTTESNAVASVFNMNLVEPNPTTTPAKKSSLSLKCKFCGLILQGQQTFNKHIRTNHNMDPNTVQAIIVEETEEQTEQTDRQDRASQEDESSVSSESFRTQASGRVSVASNFASGQEVKCALCPETFSSHELLQKHTLSHFDQDSNSGVGGVSLGVGSTPLKSEDEILREKLLRQTMRKKKKKKNKGLSLGSGQGPLSASATSSSLGAGAGNHGDSSHSSKPVKFKKTYSCLLCDSTFIKKASWRIHKIRHNGKGWKCPFCTDLNLFATREDLKDHLITVHKMESEEIEMLSILKDANMFVVTKKVKERRFTSKHVNHDSSDSEPESESDSDTEGAEIQDTTGVAAAGVMIDEDDDIDFEDEDDLEEDDTTTNASTPTPLSGATPSIIPILPRPPPIAAASIMTSTVQVSSINASDHLIKPVQAAPSPTPSSSSGSGVPTLKYIEDESLFDLDALTCHACNKSFKNTRAFKLHRDRHQGALKHKCPECIKTFNGRSEVNRHMVAIHGRALNTDEDTLHKKIDLQQGVKPMVITNDPNFVGSSATAVTPSASSNFSSLNTDDILASVAPPPQQTPSVPLLVSPMSSMPSLATISAPDDHLLQDSHQQQQRQQKQQPMEPFEPEPVKSLQPSMPPLSTITSELEADLIMTSTPILKKSEKQPPTIQFPSVPLRLDMPSLLDMPVLPERISNPVESVEAKPACPVVVEVKAPSEIEPITEISVKEHLPIEAPPPEKKLDTSEEDKAFDALFDDVKSESSVPKIQSEGEKPVLSPTPLMPLETTLPTTLPPSPVNRSPSVSPLPQAQSPLMTTKLTQEPVDEEELEEQAVPQRRRGRSQALLNTSPCSDKSDKIAEIASPSMGSKKKRGRPKRAGTETSTSEDSCQEKEKENKTVKKVKVASSSSKVPSHKITLPGELCQVVEGKKGKKMYQCQICSKEFHRKDIINYHVYNEHQEEFLEFGKCLPEALTRDDNEQDSTQGSKGASSNAAAAIFKRIFKPKVMSGNKDSARKGQVAVEIKSKGNIDDEDELRLMRTTSHAEAIAAEKQPKNYDAPSTMHMQSAKSPTQPPLSPPKPSAEPVIPEAVEKSTDKADDQESEKMNKEEKEEKDLDIKKSPAKRGRKPKVPKQILPPPPSPSPPPPSQPTETLVKQKDVKVADDCNDDDFDNNESVRTTRRSASMHNKQSEDTQTKMPAVEQKVINDPPVKPMKEPQIKLKPVEISLTAMPMSKALQIAAKGIDVIKETSSATEKESKPKRPRKAKEGSPPPQSPPIAVATEKGIEKLAKKLSDKLPEKGRSNEKQQVSEDLRNNENKKDELNEAVLQDQEKPIMLKKEPSTLRSSKDKIEKVEQRFSKVEKESEKVKEGGKVEEEEEEDTVKALFKEHGGNFGKTGLKVTQILDHVEALLHYQEQQRRLRNHTLMDSPEATKIMKMYKRKKPKKFTILTNDYGNDDKTRIVLSRIYDKPVHTIQKSIDSQFKFKLVKRKNSLTTTKMNLMEFAAENKTKNEITDTEKSPESQVPKQPTKKRGRPPKKAILEDLEAASIVKETSSPPPAKRRLIDQEPQEQEPITAPNEVHPPTASESSEAMESSIEIEKPQRRGRGRPPKKAIIADFEAEMAAAEKVKESELNREEAISEEAKEHHPATSNSTNEEKPLKKRGGRVKKDTVNEVNIGERDEREVDETSDEPPVKKRALRERKPMSLAEMADEDFEDIPNEIDEKLVQPKKDEIALSEVNIEEQLQSTKIPNLKSLTVGGATSSLVKDNDRYVVQHVDQNPLKIKLKAGFQELNSKQADKAPPLKIKFSLKGGSERSTDESSPLMIRKVKKHKKKKNAEKIEEQVKDKIILRIKSPSNRSDGNDLGIGNNGYLGWNNDKHNNDNNKTYPSSRIMTNTQHADIQSNNPDHQVTALGGNGGDQVTFSPESSPEHQSSGTTATAAASFIMDSSIGLGEGQFKDLMKAIDSDDENTKPAKVTTSWMTTANDKASTSSVKQSQLDGNIEQEMSSSPLASDIDEGDVLESADYSDSGSKTTKSCLIKHVFTAVAKKRKIVIVKYRQPVQLIHDLIGNDGCQSDSRSNRSSLDFDDDIDKIDQLDGENDLILDDIEASTAASVGSGSGSSTLYILKSQDAKVYQCAQCPEVFPGQKALLTHQSLVHHDSLTIYPCQQCSIGFRDANSLEIHMRNEHGKQQIVTIIQADLHTRSDTGSTASGSSSCSSSTTSSHPSSSSSGYLSAGSGSSTHHSDLLGTSSCSSSSLTQHPLLMKQDPVLMFNSDEEQDLMLDESLNLFETSSLIDSGDSAIHLSLDDLANFATQPMVTGTDGSHTSFDTSIETSSFLSGTDALDIINDASNAVSNATGPAMSGLDQRTSLTGSRTPSISDDGEFPCTQCEKRFGNRRNLLSHMRRHTGDFKLFCDHCSKGFFTQSKLESHKRKHTGMYIVANTVAKRFYRCKLDPHLILGEKPFRCLLKTCLKRFRYKGDLSKHIKKYHPGHSQDLTPVPLQDDELLNLQQQNQTQTMTGTNAKTSTVKPSSSSTTANAQAIVISNATTNNADQADNKLFLPLLPRHPVQQEDLIGFSKDTTVSDTSIDPSLDDNILDLLTDDTDSPMLLSSISPGPSLPPPPPPPMPPPKTSSNIAAATIVSSKLHEVLTQGRPKAGPASSSDQQAFVVPTSSMKSNKTTTHIVNLAPVNASTSSSSPSFKNKPLAISISQVFACAQPLPLQEDAKHGNKGKQTTMADLETRGSASSVLSANAAFVQGLVNARKTGTTIIATSGSGGNIIRTNNQQVSIIKPASSSSSSLASLKQTLTSPMSSSPSSIHSTTIANSNTAACSKTFVCDFKGCNKSFEKVTFLKRHAKLHSSNCKFVCDVCTKCFESQSKLDDHYRKHTGAKPFICHICGNAFRYKGNASCNAF